MHATEGGQLYKLAVFISDYFTLTLKHMYYLFFTDFEV
jgi:hypothetical protein